MLTGDEFLIKYGKAPEVFSVDLPDGEKVFVRMLTAHEKTEYESQFADKKKKGALSSRERLIALCACDEVGKLLFGPEHITRIGQLPVKIAEPIFDKAFEVNGFKAQLAEITKKNSESDQDAS